MAHKILTLFFLFTATAASGQRIFSKADLDERNDHLYIKGTDSLFNGILEDTIAVNDDYIRAVVADGKCNGLYEGFYDQERTILKWRTRQKEGELNGRYLYYYEDGTPCFKARNRHDMLEGRRVCYQEDGTRWHVHHYRRGKPSGTTRTWYSNGKKKVVINYCNGIKQGRYIKYDDEGNIRQKGRMANDKRDGRWRQWSDQKRLEIDVTFRDGQVVIQRKEGLLNPISRL